MTFWSLCNVLKFVRRFFQKRRKSSEISPNHQINSTHALFLSTLVCRRLSHCMSSTYILQRLQHIRLLPDCCGYIRCIPSNNFHSQLFFFRKGVQTNFLFGCRLCLFFWYRLKTDAETDWMAPAISTDHDLHRFLWTSSTHRTCEFHRRFSPG